MTQTPSPLVLAGLVALAVPAAAVAHGVRTEVERRGAEVAVRAHYESGRPLAGARFEVTSPARPERSHAEGRTDREGWLVFTPDAPGTWQVRIVDATGHGRVVKVEVAPPPPSAPSAPAPAPERTPPPAAPHEAGPGLLLRTAGGVALVALVFGGLYAAGRRRRAAGR